jgi:hypothetical protein
MRKGWFLILALAVSTAEARDAGAPRQVYRQETQKKIRQTLGRRPNAEEKALIKKHLRLTARLHKIIARAEENDRPKVAARARELLARADRKLYERLQERAK